MWNNLDAAGFSAFPLYDFFKNINYLYDTNM